MQRALLKFHCMREEPAISFGLLKRYFLLGKIQNEGQSAGYTVNVFSVSSETIRETFILKDKIFIDWFIGFTEGCGRFIVSKEGELEFKITQPSEDAQILFYIKKRLGFGTVRVQDKNNKTHCFKVKNREGLFKLIFIFNNNLYLESRKEEFKNWLFAYNKLYIQEISYIKSNRKPSLDDYWLSGFSDAIGCFTCSILYHSKEGKSIAPLVRLKYLLWSGKNSVENFKLMEHLAEILGGKTHYIENYNGYCTAINRTKLTKTIRYFKLHPLKTHKSIIYLNWYKIYKLVNNKQHLTVWGLNKIKTYQKTIDRLSKKI
jgi:hypothetical protein